MRAIPVEIAAPLLAPEVPVDWETLYQALSELPAREQSIISLRFFAGLKHEQIGEVLEIKPGNVRVALNRALNKLRDRLRDGNLPTQPMPGTRKGQ
jgi:DNA-directed RNA polymerase specialized sigma24 family protein